MREARDERVGEVALELGDLRPERSARGGELVDRDVPRRRRRVRGVGRRAVGPVERLLWISHVALSSLGPAESTNGGARARPGRQRLSAVTVDAAIHSASSTWIAGTPPTRTENSVATAVSRLTP